MDAASGRTPGELRDVRGQHRRAEGQAYSSTELRQATFAMRTTRLLWLVAGDQLGVGRLVAAL